MKNQLQYKYNYFAGTSELFHDEDLMSRRPAYNALDKTDY